MDSKETTSPSKRRMYRLIKSSYLDLLDDKNADEINVTDVCERADINRSTFYRHFADVRELRDSVIDDLFNDIFISPITMQQASPKADHRNIIALTAEAVDKIYNNRKLFTALVCRNDDFFTKRLISDLKNILLKKEIDSAVPEEEYAIHSYMVDYYIGGSMTILKNWLLDDCRTDKAVIAELTAKQLSENYKLRRKLVGEMVKHE